MARTPLFRSLRRALAAARSARTLGVAPREMLEQAQDQKLKFSRRQALKATLGGAALVGTPWSFGCGSDDPAPSLQPSIAVVGAGISGLTAAYRLKQAGLRATIYDASDRVGGRMFTARGMFGTQIAELGGEFIDTGHETMLGLATELGVELDDLLANPPANFRQDTYYFGNTLLTEAEIVEMFTPLAEVMATTVTNAEADPALFEMLDGMSMAEWLMTMAPVDSAGLRPLLEVAYRGEYGLEIDEQSIFNLLYLIDYETPDPFRIYGDSDERFHVHEGSDTIPTKLAQALAGQIETGARLVRVKASEGSKVLLTFMRGAGTADVEVDHALITLPFTMLREVDLSMSGFSAEKMQIINEIGYGTNVKLMGQFNTRVWNTVHNASGSSYSDTGSETTWDTSRGQEGANGILTVYLGGDDGIAASQGTADDRYRLALPGLETLFPGTTAAYRANSAVRMHWPTNPLMKGSYTCYRPGQWAFAGLEGERQGNVHFAGEHCSVDFQGYMEGAAETGAKAAAEIMMDLGLSTPNALRAIARARRPLRQRNFIGRALARRRR